MKLALLVLVACGHQDSPPVIGQSGKPIDKIQGEDDSCDPKTPRVCMGNDVVECAADGHLGRRVRACHHGCVDGACDEACADDNTKLIYIVSTSNDFLGFDPRKLATGDPIKRIGKLTCEPYGSPFSMTIDRSGVAWVEYDDGQVFNVNLTTAECKKPARMYGPNGVFTMAFVADGDKEQLYTVDTRTAEMFTVDPKSTVRTPVETVEPRTDESVDLTGTGDGKLYGFFTSTWEVPYVQELDRKTAHGVGKRMPLGTDAPGQYSAWAFAQWGGSLYLFTSGYDFSQVHTIDRQTGAHRTVISDLGYRISGAGVSTCAPERDVGRGQQTP
ncbi:MAG: hypothetical protein QM831_02425 [Kofleriaceae bacterium]